MIEHPCQTCHGSGRLRSTKTYQVRIPPGVRDGTRIKVKGKGEAAPRGGEPGDLYVVTRVTESPLFKRRGSDMVIDVPVTFTEAAMGSNVELPTPDGTTVRVKVPAGSSSGRRLRLRGQGLPGGGGSAGDLYAVVMIHVPKKLTKRQRELFEQLASTSKFDPRRRR